MGWRFGAEVQTPLFKRLFYWEIIMTVKEIAEAVGKTDRAVRGWAKKVSEKNSKVSEKISKARATSQPADYTFDETCAIIEQGMGKNAAGVYRAAAQPVQQVTGSEARIDRLESMVEKLVVAVTQIPAQMAQMQSNAPQLEYKQDYYTIKGYAIKIGMPSLAFSDAVKFGKDAAALSREQGYEMRKADDERFGTVNSYHVDILQQVFEL